jgi:hypothetical protein
MMEFDTYHKTFKIIIPVATLSEAGRYHQSLIKLLERIEIDEDIPSLIENLDCIYELLSHLLPDQAFIDHYKDLTNEP